jgi:hypothetical protein
MRILSSVLTNFPAICPDCGRVTEPCYAPGPCEACYSDRAARYHCPGAFKIGMRAPVEQEKDESDAKQLRCYERGSHPAERKIDPARRAANRKGGRLSG